MQTDSTPFPHLFRSTTATYKFYWFLGFLELVVKLGRRCMDAWDIMVEMIANAWYPVCYFHLSFGRQESLYEAILRLQQDYGIASNVSVRDLKEWLHTHESEAELKERFKFLYKEVPYRMLSPWIHERNNATMAARSLSFENNCLYRINLRGTEMWIEANEYWTGFLEENYNLLRDYTYWNLTLFLQARNPNVPNVSGKLIKPEARSPLNKQHAYWDFTIDHGADLRCIYTGHPIVAGAYELDHFLPWSFVSHDLLWNLLPADSSVNASKSNRLPRLDTYLDRLAALHQQALRTALSHQFRDTGHLLEDYLSLGATPAEIASMDTEHLHDIFHRTYSPMVQIARNMGFESWNAISL